MDMVRDVMKDMTEERRRAEAREAAEREAMAQEIATQETETQEILSQNISGRWKQWERAILEDPDLSRELNEMKDDREHGEERIHDCFYKDLEFGTGGLRGIMGAGTNRMNIYTVARASQGYAEYLKDSPRQEISLAIAYDSRLKSKEFARTAAEVFVASGIRVYMFPELVPTPMLSYGVRYLKCDGGVVITASHNPAEYNGYKVYGPDGGQITGAVAKGILAKISGIHMFSGVEKMDFDTAMKAGYISYIDDTLMEAYYEAVSAEAFGGKLDRDIKIVYTPLNGAGLKPVCQVLKRNGFTDISVVEEQRDPDGNFPTCPYPNPEKAEALELAIRDAGYLDSDLVLATDPDCDRVGIAVRSLGGNSEVTAVQSAEGHGEAGAITGQSASGSSGYRLLTGNETGVLLLDYVARRRRENGVMPEKPVAAKTIVTTDLAVKVAQAYGVEMRDVLTGFKYIGEQIGILEAKGDEGRFILGMEESYGYLTGSYVRDKDGVNASLLICEMAAYYKMRGLTLEQVLEDIYRQYGYYLNTQLTFTFAGEEGSQKMEGIMEEIRRGAALFPALADNKMVRVEDYQASQVFLPEGLHAPLKLPRSNVLKMMWEDGSSLTVRPSGTEPKLKIYISATGENQETARRKEHKIREKIQLLYL